MRSGGPKRAKLHPKSSRPSPVRGNCKPKAVAEAAAIEKAAGQALEAAERLFTKSHQLDQKADERHHGVDQLHEKTDFAHALVTSRRFFQESRGMQLLLLSFEELSGNNR